MTKSKEWRFVPWKLNPVEASTCSIIGEKVWLKIWQDVPEFLLKLESDFPTDLLRMAAPTELKTTKLYHDQTTPNLFDRLAVSLDQFNISFL